MEKILKITLIVVAVMGVVGCKSECKRPTIDTDYRFIYKQGSTEHRIISTEILEGKDGCVISKTYYKDVYYYYKDTIKVNPIINHSEI